MRDQLILIYSYLHGIWQYRWSALAITCLVALFGWAVVYTLPNKYASQAVVLVDTTSVMKPLLKGLSVQSDTEEAGINIMSRVLLSRNNLKEVLRQTDMDLKADSPEAMEKMLRKLSDAIDLRLSGKRRRGSNIYELSYEGNSPEQAYQVVSKLLNTLIENTLDSARSDTATAQQFLDQQINEYEIRLTLAEQELAKFKRANVGFMPDEKGGYYTRLQREEAKLDSIFSALRLAKRKYATMLKQLEGETPLLGSGSYAAPKAMRLRRYREQLEQLLTQYKEQHPDVKALRATIANLIANDNVADDGYVVTGAGESAEFNPVYQDLKAEIHKAKIEVETAKIQLIEQQNTVQELKKDVDVLPGVEAGLAKLNRDYEITRERYLSLVTRRESARLTQAIGQSGSNIKFRVIDSPQVPTKPSGPKRLLFLTVAFVLAVGAGLAWGFFRYLMQPTLIDVSQIREKIGLPLLGSVGLYLTKKHKLKRRMQLAGFLSVFAFLVLTYGAALFFSDIGSQVVHEYMVSRGLML